MTDKTMQVLAYITFSIILWKTEQYGATDVCVTVAPVNGWSLVGHTFKTKESTTLSHCTFYCEIEDGCFSINFASTTNACELNVATKEMFPFDFTRKENYLYVHNVLRERNPCVKSKCQNNGRCISSGGQQLTCICFPEFTGSLCEIRVLPNNSQPLGMENGKIADNQVRSKSDSGANYPWKGRLNSQSSWIARVANRIQWLGVSFGNSVVLFSQIATQGSPIDPCWVTRYTLEYFGLSYEWKKYEENGLEKTFEGNTNQNTTIKNRIDAPFKGTFIKVKPSDWFNGICMRLELYGAIQKLVP